ncbi:hypothetical protein F5Y17DRAFT_435147 [Xylariaceae sp. FL0594]|nr:hypothetical protein F5Y17DRAFT_435147 [Xylariaceae sp. FL0594]
MPTFVAFSAKLFIYLHLAVMSTAMTSRYKCGSRETYARASLQVAEKVSFVGIPRVGTILCILRLPSGGTDGVTAGIMVFPLLAHGCTVGLNQKETDLVRIMMVTCGFEHKIG